VKIGGRKIAFIVFLFIFQDEVEFELKLVCTLLTYVNYMVCQVSYFKKLLNKFFMISLNIFVPNIFPPARGLNHAVATVELGGTLGCNWGLLLSSVYN
jgi:hypothetical protein